MSPHSLSKVMQSDIDCIILSSLCCLFSSVPLNWLVSGLSRQFLDCRDRFWIVWTVFKLFRQFLDFLDNFCIIRTVFGLSVQFPACVMSFQKIYGLYGLKHHIVYILWRCHRCGTNNNQQGKIGLLSL